MSRKSRQILPQIPSFEELSFRQPDPQALLTAAEEAAASLQAGKDPERIKMQMLSFQQLLLYWQSAKRFEQLKSVTAGKSAARSPFFETHAYVPAKGKAVLFRALLNSPYEGVEHSGEDREIWSEAWRWSRYEDPVPEAILIRERDLGRRLKVLCPSLIDIAERSEIHSLSFWSEASENDRYRFGMLLGETLEQDSREREELLLELFAVRREIARYCGFPNYSDYHAARRGRRDFSRREERRFIQLYRKHMIPVVQEILSLRSKRFNRSVDSYFDLGVLLPQGDPPLKCQKDEFLSLMLETLEDLTGDKDHLLLDLLRKGYVSFDARAAEKIKKSGVLLPSIPSAFLLLPIEAPFFSISGAILACGNALAEVSAMLNYHILGASEQDSLSKAISSFYFLALSQKRLDLFYDNASVLALDIEWSRQLMRQPFDLAVYEMEERIYTSGSKLSIRDFNYHWSEMHERWFPWLADSSVPYFTHQNGWQYLLSLQNGPYTSLASSMGMLSVLAEHPARVKSRQLINTLNRYLLTNPGSPVHERFEASAVSSPVRSETIRKAAFSACDLLGL